MRWLPAQPQRAVGFLALVVALLLCALVANDLWRDYAQRLVAANAKTGSLTQLLEEHARQTMRRVELALAMAAQEVQSQSQKQGGVTTSAGTLLRDFLPHDGLIASFTVLDAQGKVIASSLTDAPAELLLASEQDHYRAHPDSAHNEMFVGQSVKSRISGLWIVPVSIKLSGGFEGYLMAAVDPEYFQRLYRSIDTGDNGFVTLLTTQGWAIARWPFTSEVADKHWLDSALFTRHLRNSSAAAVQENSMVDGTPVVYSYRVLNDYPLVVMLGLSRDEILLPWRTRALIGCVGLALVLLFLGASTARLVSELRRRMQAEAALQLSEISVLKSSLPTLWIGPDARILRVNQAACDLHGLSEAQMLRMTIPDLNPGMLRQAWPAHWERLRQSRNMRFETRHTHSNGSRVPVEAELNFIEFDGQEYNFAFLRDLTQRKQAEAEIQRSAATLRGAIDAVDEAFVLFDADDRLVYCNAKYRELYPELQGILKPGVRFEALLHAGARLGLYREALGREEAWITERLRAHREGNEARIQKRDDGRVMRVIDRKTPEGNVVGIRVDITDMVRATEEAQEASRTKSQFLANMSHEIRTPMNAILGLLTLLQNTELSRVQRDYAVKTASAAQSLLGLLNDILDFSKVEAGKMALDPQPFRLDRMLHDLAVILSSNMAGKSIEVLFDVDARLPAVLVADAMRLQQVLVNLGGNAIKFTTEGQVVLRLRSLALDESAGAREALVEFSMQDSGIGIALESQQHIFTGFSQAEASTTRRFGGTGLGLAICKRLVELMGGTLNLRSEPGVGSTFSFQLRLPVADTLPGDPAQALQEAAQAQRVLVVDDNPVAREILSNITRSWGWPTESVASGEEALAVMRQRRSADALPFDLVCLDWQMPGMDGWEVAQRMRADCQGLESAPRLVMLSANGRDSLTARTAQEQALVDGFLFKPVTASALQDAALGRNSWDVPLRTPQHSRRALVGMRVLVVEDNLINQQVAEELLHAEGALVSLAANGQLGVDAVAASEPPFDVVLMDIQMPVLDGYGATRKIRQDLGLTQLPIVAMTANAMDSDRQACLAAGMNEHVGKPFDVRHLVEVLLRVTGQQQPLRPAQAGAELQSAAADDPDLAVFNSPYLNVASAVARLSGMRALYLDVLKEFALSLDAVEGAFRQAAAQGKPAALLGQMHTLKGTAATLGANPLSERAAQLEKLLRNPPPELVVLDHLPGLLACVDLSRAAAQDAWLRMQAAPGQPGLPQHQPSLTTEPMEPAQHALALHSLQELSTLLHASNLAALEFFRVRRPALDGLPAGDVEAIHLALQALDFDAARQLCELQIATLEAPG